MKKVFIRNWCPSLIQNETVFVKLNTLNIQTAESIISGRLLAAIKNTPFLLSIPSISVNIWKFFLLLLKLLLYHCWVLEIYYVEYCANSSCFFQINHPKLSAGLGKEVRKTTNSSSIKINPEDRPFTSATTVVTKENVKWISSSIDIVRYCWYRDIISDNIGVSICFWLRFRY